MLNNTFRVTAVAATVAGLIASAGVSAQNAAGADDLALEEIVVTARKREESLQDVPLTVTAVSATQIAELGIKDSRDLALFTPGFSNVTSFGRNSSERPTIRGQSNILGAANAAYFVDGVYISGSASNTETANLERIEVIKGPQAALFGRATFAGAINYVTRKPSEEFEGQVSGTIGKFDQKDVTAFFSGPLIDGKLNFYISGTHTEIGGFYDNPLDSRDDLGAEQTDAATGKLRWRPAEGIDITALITYAKDKDAPPALGVQGRQFNNCQLNDPVLRPRSRGYFCGEALPINQLTIAQLTDLFPNPGTRRDRVRGALTASFTTSSGYELVSTTGYSEENYEVQIDVSYGGYDFGVLAPVPVATAFQAQWATQGAFQRFNGDKRNDLSQELRLSSPVDRKLRWTVGAYYFAAGDDFVRDDKLYRTGALIVPNGTAALTYRDIKNTAVFGSLEWDISDKWTVTAEARQAEETIDQQSFAFPTNGTERVPGRMFNGTFKSYTPRFTLRYKPNEDLSLFANYAQGTKPGGFNGGTVIPLLEAVGKPIEIKEEESENIEIGAKFNMWGSRLTASITAFDINLTNQQLTQNIVGVSGTSIIANSFIENVGKTSSRGLELELAARVTDNLRLAFGGALIDATFDEYINSDQADLYSNRPATAFTAISATNPRGCGVLGASAADNAAACLALRAQDNREFGNVAGKRTPRSPKWNAFVTSRYSRPLNDTLNLVVGVDVTAEGSKYAQVHNLIETGARKYLNARVGVESDAWTVTLWGRNLADDDTPLDILRYVDGGGLAYIPGLGTRGFTVSLPRPRQVGLSATYKF
jgi:outer membrane receptor protein involved in Fe transport